MNTAQDKLTYLQGTKEAIKQAIIDKGVNVLPSDTFRSYAGKIANIKSGGSGLDWSAVGYSDIPQALKLGYDYTLQIYNSWVNTTNLNSKFANDKRLLILPKVDTSLATNMDNFVYQCSSMFQFPELDTSKVESAVDMFYYCSSLCEIPLLDFGSVSGNLSGTFYGCNNVRKLTIKNLGKNPNLTAVDFRGASWTPIPWGIDGNGLTNCKKTVIDTLINYSFDRKRAGYGSCTVTLSPNTKNLLSESEKAQITNKGFTIA